MQLKEGANVADASVKEINDGTLEVNPILLNGHTNEEKINDLLVRLEEGIQNVFDSDSYKRYLSVMSKFHTYSYRNCMLILLQKPDATFVRGYQAWKKDKETGRHVKNGEKGIRIIVGNNKTVYKMTKEIDPNTGQEEQKKVKVQIPYFSVGYVYDVSQTEGKELPTLCNELTAGVEDFNRRMEALKSISPVPIEFEEITGSGKGYFHRIEKRIAIKQGMSELQTLKTAIHEISHALLHDFNTADLKQEKAVFDKNLFETQAESIAFIVCSYLGLDTSEYSFGYLASWSKSKELDELKSSLEIIHGTAKDIIEKMDVFQKSRVKEKSKNKKLDIALI